MEVTPEDRRRAIDRSRVRSHRLRGRRSKTLLWLLIGPGVLVMLGENDAPSMLSYAATGAQFGISAFLPFIVLTFAMAFVVQEMTVRVGMATQKGHAELIFERFGTFWGWCALGDLLLTNFLTLVTEFIGVRAGLGYFGVPAPIAVLAALLVSIAALTTARYWTWERLALGLALVNLVFVPVAILTYPTWSAAAGAASSFQLLPGGFTPNAVLIIVADIGATVTPWMLFFQQGASVDKGLTHADLRHSRFDTALGAVLAAVAAMATVVATSILFGHPSSAGLQDAADFAHSIEPGVGHVGAALFAIGIFEAGLAAIVMISASSGYAFGEVLGRPHSLNRRFGEAPQFYLVLITMATAAAGVVLIPGIPLEFFVLIVNVVAVMALPPALVFLYILANDRELMGEARNSRRSNILAGLVLAVLVAAGLTFAASVLLPGLFGISGAGGSA